MGTQRTWEQELALCADEYCSLIENLEQVSSAWLDDLTALLPRIHAAVSALPANHSDAHPHTDDVDLDKRFELFSRLRTLLGDHDGYPLDFDKPEIEGVSGSLADDFTDIYFELKKCLRLLEHSSADRRQLASAWYGGYLWHWGQHLVDAEKHLYDLQVHRHLGGRGY